MRAIIREANQRRKWADSIANDRARDNGPRMDDQRIDRESGDGIGRLWLKCFVTAVLFIMGFDDGFQAWSEHSFHQGTHAVITLVCAVYFLWLLILQKNKSNPTT
jgi:hypothetical protein